MSKLLLVCEEENCNCFLIYKSLYHLYKLIKTINKENPKLSHRRDVNNPQSTNYYLLADGKLRRDVLTLPWRLQKASDEQSLEEVTQ